MTSTTWPGELEAVVALDAGGLDGGVRELGGRLDGPAGPWGLLDGAPDIGQGAAPDHVVDDDQAAGPYPEYYDLTSSDDDLYPSPMNCGSFAGWGDDDGTT